MLRIKIKQVRRWGVAGGRVIFVRVVREQVSEVVS
jgi:hypothetical protein